MDKKNRPDRLFLFIFLFALILRVWGIGFGLPYAIHQDEPIIVNHALAYGTGDLNPHFFIIPPLCSYILFFFYGLFFMLGKISGLWSGTQDFAHNFFVDPTYFYMIARMILGIVPGMASIYLVYKIYRDNFSREGALYAAGIVGACFLAVVNAHYAYTDNMLVMFILLSYISFFRILRKPKLSNYVLAGIIMGLAISVKYNAAILIMPFMLGHFFALSDEGGRGKQIFFYPAIAIIAAIIAFIVTNPFSVLDWGSFSSSIFGKIRHGYMGWTHHLLYSLHEGVGAGILVLSFLGVVSMFLRGDKKKFIFIFSFPFAFYLHLVLASQRFSRYVLPLLPFIAIFAAFFVFEVILPMIRNKRWKNLVMITAVIVIVPTVLKSITADRLFSGEDTRVLSARWIEGNIPEGANIAVDHTAFRPAIFQSVGQLREKYTIAENQKGLEDAKKKRLDLAIKAVQGKKTYDVYFLTMRDEERGQFLSTVPAVKYDIEDLKDKNIEYVVLNLNKHSAEKDGLREALAVNAEVIKEFSPYRDGEIRPCYDNIDFTFMPVASKELFERQKTGPAFIVYRLER